MRKSQFDTIRTYLAGFETQMNAQFNSLHGRLGEIEKRIANPETAQPNAQPVRIMDLRLELNALADKFVAELARYEGSRPRALPSVRDQILSLAEEL